MNAHVPRQSHLSELLHGPDGPTWGTNPADFDPKAIRQTMGTMARFFDHYFRVESTGWDNLPKSPVILVGNHSGGTSIPDAWGLMRDWYRHNGFDRPLHALAHELVFSNAITGPYFARRGVVRAGRNIAHEVLQDLRHDLLVMPGGDKDTWRPYRDRYKVCFSGRTGYARLALETGVPCVPVAHAGSHETLIVLTRGDRIAKAVRLHKVARAEIWPIHLSFPWGLTLGPLPHIPTPALLRYRVGEPVPFPEGFGADTPVTDDLVEEYDRRVRAALQAELDVLAAERKVLAERVIDESRKLARRSRRAARKVTEKLADRYMDLFEPA